MTNFLHIFGVFLFCTQSIWSASLTTRIKENIDEDATRDAIIVDAKAGFISTPGFDASGLTPYPDNLNVSWLISVKANEVIKIKIIYLDLESDCSGRLIFQEFDAKDADDEKVEFCGRSKKIINFISKTNHLLVSFVGRQRLNADDDTWPQTSGFKLFFQAVPPMINYCDNINERLCKNRLNCYNETLICDGVDDCGDGTDEESCPLNDIKIDAKNILDANFTDAKTFLDANFTDANSERLLIDQMLNLIPGQADCGDPYIKPVTPKIIFRIVGGNAATPNSFPWMASLRDETNAENGVTGHFCAASLITNQHIVSASHCFANYRAGKSLGSVSIYFGKHHKLASEENEILRYIADIKYFTSSSDDDIEHDITLIKLNAPIDLELNYKHISTVCLPKDEIYKETPTKTPNIFNKISGYSRKAIVTGWGETYDTGNADVLKQAIIPIFAKDKCEKYLKSNAGTGVLVKYFICAGGKLGTDTCDGDSGGPLVTNDEQLSSGRLEGDNEVISQDAKWTLRGITSQGSNCCGCNDGEPAIYTNVYPYLKWIIKNVIS